MLDKDLAELYHVTTGNLNKAVKRNIKRFPPDFMFQLTNEEFLKLKENLIFQNGISNWGGTRKLPYAFTEQGLAMLSGVLNSDIAINVNISIMRAFDVIQLRKDFEELKLDIEDILHDQNDINESTRAQRSPFFCPFTTRSNSFPLLCRRSFHLSQQLRQESG